MSKLDWTGVQVTLLGKRGLAYLRDEAVWQGQAENTSDKGRAAEQEKIPVEAAGLLEGVLARLRRDAAHVLRPWECVGQQVHFF